MTGSGERPARVIGEEVMRRLGVWGWSAVRAFGMTVSVAVAADDDDTPKKATTWKLGGNGKFGKPVKPPPKKKEPVKEPPPPPSSREVSVAARRDRELNAYLRRTEAC